MRGSSAGNAEPAQEAATAIPGAPAIRALIADPGLRGGTSERGENTMCNLSSGRTTLREDLGSCESCQESPGLVGEPSGAGMSEL